MATTKHDSVRFAREATARRLALPVDAVEFAEPGAADTKPPPKAQG